MFHVENLYFYTSDNECIYFLKKALELCDTDKDFKYADIRQNDIEYQLALSLHRTEKIEEAQNLYLKLLNAGSKHIMFSRLLSFINCLNYLGHIYKHLGDKENALKSYERAIRNIEYFFDSKVLDEKNYLIQKIRTFMFIKCFYREFNVVEKLTGIEKDIETTLDKLMVFAPDEAKNIPKDDPRKYPLEIGQIMINGCTHLPESTRMRALGLQKLD